MNVNARRLKCSMCEFSSQAEHHLLSHYVRRHRFDPRFRVNCNHLDCGASFSKWASYKKHLQRVHRNHLPLPDEEIYVNADDHLQVDQDDGEEIREQVDHRRLLQLSAARLLVHLRDVCNTSHKAMESVMTGMEDVMKYFVAVLTGEVRAVADVADGVVTAEDLQRITSELCPTSQIFSHVNTKRKLDSFMVNHFNFITPREIEIRRTRIWRRRPALALVQKKHCGYIIPLILSLQRMLGNADVRDCVENPRPNDDTMKTVLDGIYFKSHPFFSSTRNALAIILYYDELEIVNPLGSRSHKLGMFYWTLANIHPEFRSSLRVVNLYAIAKYQDISKYRGMDLILEQFAREIEILETDGVTVQVHEQEKTYRGSLLMVTGDTPASAFVGGFKRSVSATRPCRRCMTTSNEWRHFFKEENFTLRSMQLHHDHLESICDPENTLQMRNYWRQIYGVNEKSKLLLINNFDITRCLVQDIMHVLSEGVIEVETRLLIEYCVSQGIFSLQQLNERIANFDYGHLTPNKPSSNIIPEHLNNRHLRQSAAQMVCLAHVLPFLVGDFLLRNGSEDSDALARLLCHTKLMQISNVCFAYELTVDDAHFLGTLIERFLTEFCLLYGKESMVPKFHFLVHVVSQIEDFGPLRQQFCYRFEAANARYKFLARVVRSFVNMPWTLAYRHETQRCLEFSQADGLSTSFLYQGHFKKEGNIKKLSEVHQHNLLTELLPGIDFNECNVMISPQVIIWGTAFSKGSVILLACDEGDMPQFGKIEEIIVHENKIFLIYEVLETGLYCQFLNAYQIERNHQAPQRGATNIEQLSYIHSLSIFRYRQSNFIILFSHTRTEVVD